MIDPKFYEKDFISTAIKEIDYIRSPLYDLAKAQVMTPESASDFLDDFGMKTSMIDELEAEVMAP